MNAHVGGRRVGTALAVLLVCLEAFALSVECWISLAQSFAEGRSPLEALFLFFRFFTILVNTGIAGLMAVTLWRSARGRALPVAGFYAATLVYILVVGITYEAILRRLWSPHGVQFYTDMTMHDIVPALMLVFWLIAAPKASIGWFDALRWLEVPTVYFGLILISGFFVEDYPYGFLDPDKIGYDGVIRNGLIFLAFFYALGVGVTAVARAMARGEPAVSTPIRSPDTAR